MVRGTGLYYSNKDKSILRVNATQLEFIEVKYSAKASTRRVKVAHI